MTFAIGSTVTYSITITNHDNVASPDNPGDEFTDILPSQLTLVGASSPTGTVLANVGTKTVTWNGSVPALGLAAITITATINAGTIGAMVANRGAVSFDADLNGTNESIALTDDPGSPGFSATVFTVTAPVLTATKSVSNTYVIGYPVTYTIVITNSGNVASPNNFAHEFIDTLPSSLALLGAVASSGSTFSNYATNTVTWSGSVPAFGSVMITITAMILPSAGGQLVSNQGTVLYDQDQNGSNETTVMTDDPATAAPNDATLRAVLAAQVVPTLSTWALIAMTIALATIAAGKRMS